MRTIMTFKVGQKVVSEFESSDAYEEAIFKRAMNGGYFTSVHYKSRGESIRNDFKTFPEAAIDAFANDRALVYAVSERGNQVCIPRSRWAYFNTFYK